MSTFTLFCMNREKGKWQIVRLTSLKVNITKLSFVSRDFWGGLQILLNFDGYGKIYLSSSVTERNKKLVKVCLTLVKVNKHVTLCFQVGRLELYRSCRCCCSCCIRSLTVCFCINTRLYLFWVWILFIHALWNNDEGEKVIS